MPLWQPASALARPAYYDRKARSFITQGEFTGAPHGTTVRASYAPVTQLAAFIETMYAYLLRNTAAAAAGGSNVYWEFLPAAGGAAFVDEVIMIDNATGIQRALAMSSLGYMASGDTIRLATSDGSSGGTVTFKGTIKGTEFLF